MKQVMQKFVFLGLLMGLALGCGKPPSKPFKSDVTSGQSDANGNPISTESEIAAVGDIPMEASLAAFETHVYGPVLSQYCSGCHAESFAPKPGAAAEGEIAVASPEEMDKAHVAFLSRANLQAFAGIDQTLPVLKMDYKVGGHNCWEAEPKKCYDTMTEAIKAWLGELEANGYKPKPVVYPNSTEAVMFNTAAPISIVIDPAQYVALPADKATLGTGWQPGALDLPDGPIKTHIRTDPAKAPLGAGNNVQPVAAEVATFSMNVTAPGTYYVWARILTDLPATSRFFLGTPAAANPIQMNPGVNKTWKWVQATTLVQNVITPVAFPVAAAGPVPIRLLFREPDVRVNQVVITQRKDDFNGEQFSNQYMDVRVPLKVEGVEGAAIIATVWKTTDGEGKKSLGVKELKIDSPVPLHVKNIKPLINGLYSTNHATYTIVDTVAGGPTEKVIKTGGATSSIWVADLAVDTLGFSFETLEVAK